MRYALVLVMVYAHVQVVGLLTVRWLGARMLIVAACTEVLTTRHLSHLLRPVACQALVQLLN
jgi:hypothetical protein